MWWQARTLEDFQFRLSVPRQSQNSSRRGVHGLTPGPWCAHAARTAMFTHLDAFTLPSCRVVVQARGQKGRRVGHRPPGPLLFLQIPTVLYHTVPCRAVLYRASPKCTQLVYVKASVQGWSRTAQECPVGRGRTSRGAPKEKRGKRDH